MRLFPFGGTRVAAVAAAQRGVWNARHQFTSITVSPFTLAGLPRSKLVAVVPKRTCFRSLSLVCRFILNGNTCGGRLLLEYLFFLGRQYVLPS